MHTKLTILGCLMCAAALGLASRSAFPQELVSARILSSEGAVEIRRSLQGQARLVRIDFHKNDELLAGDVITTRRGARLVLGLTDGSQAIIGGDTSVEIKDLSQSPRTIFKLLRGKTRIKIEKTGGQPNPYRVDTPTAVIAVRGTLFDVLVKESETEVFVHEGAVAVSNLLAPGNVILVSPGERSRVIQGRAPEAPSPFKPGQNDDKFNSVDESGGRRGSSPDDTGRGGNTGGSQGPGNGIPGQSGSGAAPGNPGGRPGGKRP